MFKKAVEAKSQQRLSGADRKKLKRSIKDKFPRASDSDLDALLPPKAEITVAKLQNRVHLYAVEGSFPIFFDIDGRGSEIYPTVYALWKVPELLPAFMLKGGEVSRFVIGGADLMFPGISVPAEGLPSFAAGEPWAVKVPGNPAPIAVGSTTMSSTEALKAGLRGKALRITHYYRDFLWESVEGRYVPNAGFFEDAVFEDPSDDSTRVAASETETSSNQQHNNAKSNEVEGDVNGNHIQVQDESVPALNENENDEENEDSGDANQISEGVGDLKLQDAASSDQPNDQQSLTLSTEDIDSLLDKCLLQALHTTVKDKDLPMPGSTVWWDS